MLIMRETAWHSLTPGPARGREGRTGEAANQVGTRFLSLSKIF